MGLPLIAGAQSHPPLNGVTTIPSTGSTTQMPNLASQTCTFVPVSTNTNCVYLGGGTVTGSGGANPGISLGGTGCDAPYISNITVSPSLGSIFFATDHNGNKVKWLCN